MLFEGLCFPSFSLHPGYSVTPSQQCNSKSEGKVLHAHAWWLRRRCEAKVRVAKMSSACFFRETATVRVRGGCDDGEVRGHDNVEGS